MLSSTRPPWTRSWSTRGKLIKNTANSSHLTFSYPYSVLRTPRARDVWDPRDECKLQADTLCMGISRVLKADGIFLQISFAQPHFRSKYLMASWIGTAATPDQGVELIELVGSQYEAVQGPCERYSWSLRWTPIEVESGSLNSLLYVMHKDSA